MTWRPLIPDAHRARRGTRLVFRMSWTPGKGSLGTVPVSWSIVETGDFNGDGKSDILWRDTSGNTAIWFMNGATPTGASLGVVSTDWTIQGLNAD
jgi:hypothetical protein